MVGPCALVLVTCVDDLVTITRTVHGEQSLCLTPMTGTELMNGDDSVSERCSGVCVLCTGRYVNMIGGPDQHSGDRWRGPHVLMSLGQVVALMMVTRPENLVISSRLMFGESDIS